MLVRQGKALYIGLSNYDAQRTREISQLFKELGAPFIIHQPNYNMFDRWIEEGLLDVLEEEQLGTIFFSPLAQGMLTNRYLNGIPTDSRAHRSDSPFLSEDSVESTLKIVSELNKVAENRNQILAEMALAWNLRQLTIASVLVGASRLSKQEDNVKVLTKLTFDKSELDGIERVLKC